MSSPYNRTGETSKFNKFTKLINVLLGKIPWDKKRRESVLGMKKIILKIEKVVSKMKKVVSGKKKVVLGT